jgi:hypothetical protein
MNLNCNYKIDYFHSGFTNIIIRAIPKLTGLGGLAKTYCTISRSALLGFEDVLGIIAKARKEETFVATVTTNIPKPDYFTCPGDIWEVLGRPRNFRVAG